MASLYKKGKIYWIQYYRNGKRFQESLKTDDRKEAKYLCSKKEMEIGERRNIIPDGNADIWEALERYNTSTRFQKAVKSIYDDHIRIRDYLKHINAKTIGDIEPNSLKQYLHFRFENKLHAKSKLISFNTANHIIVNLKTFLKWCLEQNLVTENPIAAYRPYKLQDRPPKALSREDRNQVLEKAKDCKLYPALVTGFFQGMRPGELERLKGGDTDFSNNVITIYKTKTKKFRLIPLNKKVFSILKKLNKKPNELYFDFTNVRRETKRLVEASGIAFNWYTCRHTFATLLLEDGVSIYKVKEWLGHTTTKTTEMYAHVKSYKDSDINRA